MKTMIIAVALAISTFASAASAHTPQQKQVTQPDWAKPAFDAATGK